MLTRNECLFPFQLAFVCVTSATPSPHLSHCLQDTTTEIVILNYTDKPSYLVPSLQSYPTPAATHLTFLLIDSDGTAPPRGTSFLCIRAPPSFPSAFYHVDFHPASHTCECCTLRTSAVEFLGRTQQYQPQRCYEGWSTSATKTGWETWGWSAWRRLWGDQRAPSSA